MLEGRPKGGQMKGLTDEKAGADRTDKRSGAAVRIKAGARTAEVRRNANGTKPKPLRAVKSNNLRLQSKHRQLHAHRLVIPLRA